jgi:eight-cysteine-cluster-containing protein
MILALFALSWACVSPTVHETPPVTEPVAPMPGPIKPLAEAPFADPVGMYQRCYDRVELPQADGECTADADCVRAGCSAELCVTRAAAADRSSTCEVLPCFNVLEACGCVAGRCQWSLRDGAPTTP